MAAKTRVLTVEEIRAREEAQTSGVEWPPESSLVRQRDEITKLTAEVTELRDKMKRRPSRVQMMEEIREIFAKYEVNPIEEILKLVRGDTLRPSERAQAWSDLAGYLYPKLKSVEMTGQVDVNFTIVVRKFGELVEEGEKSLIKQVIDVER